MSRARRRATSEPRDPGLPLGGRGGRDPLECAAMGVPAPRFLPGESALDLPAVGKNTVLVPVHPYLTTVRVRRAANAAAPCPGSCFPYGPDGRRVLRGARGRVRRERSYEERETRGVGRLRARDRPLRGRSIAFCSDALLELPLGRTLARPACAYRSSPRPTVYTKFHARGDRPSRRRRDPRSAQPLRGLRTLSASTGPTWSSRTSISPTRSRAWAST